MQIVIVNTTKIALIPYFVKFISFKIRRLKRNIIKGDWFVYHPTNRENEFVIESSKFNIRNLLKSIRSSFHENITA